MLCGGCQAVLRQREKMDIAAYVSELLYAFNAAQDWETDRRTIIDVIVYFTSDRLWFPGLQCAVIGLAVFAMARECARSLRGRVAQRLGALRCTRVGITAAITRADASMAVFYGTYGALNALVVAICLEVTAEHKVFWCIIDTACIAYSCLLNSWFRNVLIGWSARLRTLERR